MNTLLRVLDFETSGDEPGIEIVEVGWCDVSIDNGVVSVADPQSMLINPGPTFHMSPSAQGVHHISLEMLANGKAFSDASLLVTAGPPRAFVAHYADYERKLFPVYVGGAEIDWIDTYKVALRLPYSIPDYKNQTLRYFHGHDRNLPGFTAKAMPPHRAAPDAFVTAHNLAEDLKVIDFETMIGWSKEPARLPRIMFGTKHRGQAWSQAEADYLLWIVQKSELDADTKWNAQYELDRRLGVTRADYLRWLPATIDELGTVEALTAWFLEESALRHDLRILKGTAEYDQIVALCAARKAVLAQTQTTGAAG